MPQEQQNEQVSLEKMKFIEESVNKLREKLSFLEKNEKKYKVYYATVSFAVAFIFYYGLLAYFKSSLYQDYQWLYTYVLYFLAGVLVVLVIGSAYYYVADYHVHKTAEAIAKANECSKAISLHAHGVVSEEDVNEVCEF